MTYVLPPGLIVGIRQGSQIPDSLSAIDDASAEYAVIQLEGGSLALPAEWEPLLREIAKAPDVTELRNIAENLGATDALEELIENQLLLAFDPEHEHPEDALAATLVRKNLAVTRAKRQGSNYNPQGGASLYETDLGGFVLGDVVFQVLEQLPHAGTTTLADLVNAVASGDGVDAEEAQFRVLNDLRALTKHGAAVVMMQA